MVAERSRGRCIHCRLVMETEMGCLHKRESIDEDEHSVDQVHKSGQVRKVVNENNNNERVGWIVHYVTVKRDHHCRGPTTTMASSKVIITNEDGGWGA